MTVRELNKKLEDIDKAIDDVNIQYAKTKGGHYYNQPEPMAIQLLKEYAEMLQGLEVNVGGNV